MYSCRAQNLPLGNVYFLEKQEKDKVYSSSVEVEFENLAHHSICEGFETLTHHGIVKDFRMKIIKMSLK